MGFWDKVPEKKEETKSGKEEQQELELKPSEVKEKLDKIDSMETQLKEFGAKAKTLDNMQAFLDEQKQEKDARLAREAQARKAKENEDMQEEWLTDPEKAVRKTIQPLVENNLNLISKNTLRDMVESDPERYDLYSDPTFRGRVNDLIMGLAPSQRTNVGSLQNCYFVAEGQFKNEIKEGKIKSRLSAASGSASGTGASSSKVDETIHLSDAEKKAARVFGMKEEEYAAAKKKEVAYV